jgi:mannose PTS system EIID component
VTSVPEGGVPESMRWRMFTRSFLVQGSWNYETLIGTGFAFVILPVLRHLYRDDPEQLRAAVLRHADVFNSHPYLATLAAGAVARMEAEGTPPEVIVRFKNALRGSLGALGDQAIWLSWRPAIALVAISLLLVGAPWWLAVSAYLVCYNALHLWIRVWGLRAGFSEGIGVARLLRESPLNGWASRAAAVGMTLAGFCAVLAVGRAGPALEGFAVAALAAVAGAWLGLRLRSPAYLVLLLVWAFGVGYALLFQV